jgi:hypothetical protein
MNVDTKTLATIVGLMISFAGIVSTWTLLQYRIQQVENDNAKIKEDLENLTIEFRKKGEEVKCLICEAHKMQCPGC